MFDTDYVLQTGHNAGMTLREKFHVSYAKLTSCWPWHGKMFNNGYGCFVVANRYLLAHRVSYFLHHGVNPKGVVRHLCHNRSCVRPDHLQEGTQSDNVQDCIKAGRFTLMKSIRRSDGVIFPSLQEASRHMGKDASNIAKAARGEKRSAYGFQWEYLD